MSERASFLAGIRERPSDDVARLVYADWLDDHAAGDLDRATAEFIRASCAKPGSVCMPRAAYQWLDLNWQRLVPRMMQESLGPYMFFRDGRRVEGTMQVALAKVPGAPSVGVAMVDLLCARGFVTHYRVRGKGASRLRVRFLEDVIVSEQPLAVVWKRSR